MINRRLTRFRSLLDLHYIGRGALQLFERFVGKYLISPLEINPFYKLLKKTITQRQIHRIDA